MLHEYVERRKLKPALKRSLAHVLWLGGSSCSGKTAIARTLADRYGLRSYHCDEHFYAHVDRIDPARHPAFNRIKDLPAEELLMRPANVQARDFYDFYDEEFDMVVQDLLEMPTSGPVLVEGAGLRPRRVMAVASQPRQAMWLAASSEFRRDVYLQKRAALVHEILSKCEHPDRAFENWLERDELRARTLIEELSELKLHYAIVDGKRSLEANAQAVGRHFGLEGGVVTKGSK